MSGINFRDVREAMVEAHKRELAALDALACSKCGGAGECNDADTGDIMYNTWTCADCNGSGYIKGEIPDGTNDSSVD